MKLPTNGRAKALRSYFGALTIFIFIDGISGILVQYRQCLDNYNKEQS